MTQKKPSPLAVWLDERGYGALSRLSEETGLYPSHLHKIKHGSGMSIETGRKISKATGIKITELLGIEE